MKFITVMSWTRMKTVPAAEVQALDRHSRAIYVAVLLSPQDFFFYKLLTQNFSEALRRKILIHFDKLNYAIKF